MRTVYVSLLLSLLLCQGCAVTKVSSTERVAENEERHKIEARISTCRIDAIIPHLDVKDGHGEFSLTARGSSSSFYIHLLQPKWHKVSDQCSLRLKGYKIRIDGKEYADADGVVIIPFVSRKDFVRFRLVSMPTNIDTLRDNYKSILLNNFESIIHNDYIVHVSKGESKEIGSVDTLPRADGRASGKGVIIEYIVQRGDYLAKISKKFNATISSIKKLNPWMGDRDILRVGQKLKIPVNNDVR